MQLDAQTRALLARLWRGGQAAYYWRLDLSTSTWFDPSQIINPPADVNCYFGVHPAGAPRGKHQRARIADVAVINCLFAEFDAAQYGSLHAALVHINSLPIPPSILICSGGGYHAYWLLTEPVMVTDANRDAIRRLQARWVALVGGDPNAKDLARVLRVPGTLNAKYNPPRPVEFVWVDPDHFVLDCLQTHVETFAEPDTQAQPAPMPRPLFNSAPAAAYGQAAMRAELHALAATGRGGRNARLNEAAFKLGTLAGARLLDEADALAGLYYAALSMGTDASFTDAQIRATINSGFKAGQLQPREVANGRR